MGTNNTVYALIGPRGAGKSKYAEELATANPHAVLISRDKILIEMFGTPHLSGYSDGHARAYEKMGIILGENLSSRSNRLVILDAWMGTSRERRFFIDLLHHFGATRIIVLYFITPVELVNVWFWQKPDLRRASDKSNTRPNATIFSDSTPERDYELFHEYAKGIDSDGFDEVIRINPATGPLITLT